MTLWPEQHMPHYAMEKSNATATSMDFDVATYLLPCLVVPAVTLGAVVVFLYELNRLAAAAPAAAAAAASVASVARGAPALPPPQPPGGSRCFYVSGAWLFYITWSLPAIGIVQHGVLTMGADRYNYLPALMVAPVVAALVVRARNYWRNHIGPRVGVGVGVGVVLMLALLVLLTRAATQPWTNTVSLYTNAQRFRGTNTGFALNNFGYWCESERAGEDGMGGGRGG
jgi:hypothetical protein